MNYVYGMRNRPATYGTCPEGRLVDYDRPNDPRAAFGTVVYPRELAVRDLYRFEMVPVYPLPSLPLYPEHTHVERIGQSKVFVVELFDGEYFCGDHALRQIEDWIVYAPVLDENGQVVRFPVSRPK